MENDKKIFSCCSVFGIIDYLDKLKIGFFKNLDMSKRLEKKEVFVDEKMEISVCGKESKIQILGFKVNLIALEFPNFPDSHNFLDDKMPTCNKLPSIDELPPIDKMQAPDDELPTSITNVLGVNSYLQCKEVLEHGNIIFNAEGNDSKIILPIDIGETMGRNCFLNSNAKKIIIDSNTANIQLEILNNCSCSFNWANTHSDVSFIWKGIFSCYFKIAEF